MVAVVEADGLVATLIGVGVVLGSIYLLYWGAKQFSNGWTIWRNDPVDVEEVHLEEGIVEVQGVAEPIDGEVLSAQYTDRKSLAYEYERKEKRRRRDADGETEWEWETVESGERTRPFHVSDDTGTVAVDPEGATVSLDEERVGGGARTRKYEGRLEPGDHVHVFGQKRTATDGDPPGDRQEFIGDGPETDEFTVSDATEFRTVLRYLGKGTAAMLAAAVALAIVGWIGLEQLQNGVIVTLGLVAFP